MTAFLLYVQLIKYILARKYSYSVVIGRKQIVIPFPVYMGLIALADHVVKEVMISFLLRNKKNLGYTFIIMKLLLKCATFLSILTSA